MLAATLYLAGDSTLDDYGFKRHPRCSWGTCMEQFMRPGCYVANFAKSGHSTRSFEASGHWAKLMASVVSGDFVVMQFGHNDQKRTTEFYREKRWADPDGLYTDILRKWIGEVRDKGATPILVSPICRATFDVDGEHLIDTTFASNGVCLGSYRDAMAALAVETGCEFVDMNTLTRNLYESMGRDETEKLFVMSAEDRVGKDGEPSRDVTHPVKAGAEAFAKLFVEDVGKRQLSVASLFLDLNSPTAKSGMPMGGPAVLRKVVMLGEEHWWGCANHFGRDMPFDSKTDIVIDLTNDGYANQYASFMVSDKGRVIWCDDLARFEIKGGEIAVAGAGSSPIEIVETRGTLRDAFLYASKKWFPPSGKMPDPLFFSAPQYNTWCELIHFHSEKGVLDYAKSMLDNGLPPGVLMLDNSWQAGFGDWRFEASRFNNPKGMVAKLHEMGYKVVLWMVPFITMDSPAYRMFAMGHSPDDSSERLPTGGLLGVQGHKDDPAPVSWWCGKSALLDLTCPRARNWFKDVCDGLVRDYGVDGFKFDGGHLIFYNKGYETFRPATPGEQVMEYAKFNLLYPVCEYRNAWRFQGQPVVERLHDKKHTWEAVQKLVPDLLAGGLLGHSFLCPDMIGGGSATAFFKGSPFDPELYVRSAQVHALCGMMQFSASPWRCLDAEKQQIIRNLVATRQKFADRFVDLAAECGRTGEPMIRNLEYCFPGNGYAGIKDEFMMGDFLLVAPVVEKGTASRKVVIPPGKWRADDGQTIIGPVEIQVSAPLSRLPHFVLAQKGVRLVNHEQ